MKRVACVVSGVVLAICAYGQGSKPVVLGYYPSDDAYPDLVAMHTYLTAASTDVFATDSKGNITGTAPTTALKELAQTKLTAYAVVSNYGPNGFDASVAHSVISNATNRANFVKKLWTILKANKYQGANIDFEGLLPSDRKAFNAFLLAITQKLHPSGFKTVVSVPAKSVDDPTDSWSGAFDYLSIGRTVDFVQEMTYDEFGSWSAPGSVAGLDWMTACLKYGVKTISSKKLLLGLPAYANDWNLSDTTGNSNAVVLWKDIPSLLASTNAKPQRDALTQSMYFQYTATDGTKHEVWYEDATSIQEKAHLCVSLKLGGVSMWALGQEDLGFWKAVAAGLSKGPNVPLP